MYCERTPSQYILFGPEKSLLLFSTQFIRLIDRCRQTFLNYFFHKAQMLEMRITFKTRCPWQLLKRRRKAEVLAQLKKYVPQKRHLKSKKEGKQCNLLHWNTACRLRTNIRSVPPMRLNKVKLLCWCFLWGVFFVFVFFLLVTDDPTTLPVVWWVRCWYQGR